MVNDIPIKSQRIKKLVGILTENSRLTTKHIASRMRCSQQLVSYLIGRIENDTDISFTVQVDTSRLGFEHVMVGLRYKRIIPSRIASIIKKIQSEPHITLVVEGRNGVDLLLEFTSENLSAFSKQLRSLLKDESDLLDVEFMMPIIVRRVYPRSYLNRAKREVKILFGDRHKQDIGPLEHRLLQELQGNARLSLVELGRRTDSNAQALRHALSSLESEGIVRGFTLRGDVGSIGISSSWILLRLPSEGLMTIDQVVSTAEAHQHVISTSKLIGAYQVMLRIEDIPADTVLRELRTSYDIERSLVIDAHRIRTEHPLPRGRKPF